MKENKTLLIKSYEGSCSSSLVSILLIPIPFLIWAGLAMFIIEKTLIPKDLLSTSPLVFLFSALLGYGFHDFCHFFALKFFGGKPKYGKRKYKEGRSYFDRKWLFPITIRFWSPGTVFSRVQYIIIVLTPILFNYLILPLFMLVYRDPLYISVILIIGLFISSFIPMDLSIAGKIMLSSEKGQFIVDEEAGTFLLTD